MKRRTNIWRGGILVLLSVLFATALEAQISVEEHADRRAALAERVGDGLVLAVGSAEPPQDYIPFHQNSPFRYLTGFIEPNAALLMEVSAGEIESEILFVNPRDPAMETWEGYRIGPDGTLEATGISGRSVDELGEAFGSLLGDRGEVKVVGNYNPGASIRNDVTQRVDALLDGRSGVEVVPVTQEVAALRRVKSEAELELLRRSTVITVQAHREILGVLAPGRNEFEVQAVLEYTFRRYGSERPAFASIVGSGPNSTVLHYNVNNRFMEDGDVVVVDIGASYGGYAADVTRTLPVNGTFSEAQAEIYQIVRDAQARAEEMGRPGTVVGQMDQAAAQVVAEGLAEVGLIEAPDATYEAENGQRIPQFRLFYMHAMGHGIGLDVHDPWPGVLEPGVAFTIEPGIYVRPNLFDEIIPDVPANEGLREAIRPAFERYVNIGVRIEDDYIVTEDGLEWISPAPREIDEIEAAMAEPWDGPEARNADWVEWFRGME